MPLSTYIVRQEWLTESDRAAMLALHGRHYGNVRPERFMADLAAKEWVILLRGPSGALVGFSTQALIRLCVQGREHRFLFSGDTVVDHAHRHTPALAGCFGHLMLRLMCDQGEDDLHWFLITKGFRTYRFLPVFFKRFFPAFDADMPDECASLMHAVATHRFGSEYDPDTGIVRPGAGGDRLLPELARVPPGRLRDPHVAYFLRRNPGFAAGDEMACLTAIRRDNLNPRAWRVIHATTPTW
ncbi:MAG: hypothetical protein A3K19_13370 [Lentisphaerae bacterium RIFOXYB12_FULL_65_16]|nr:MAG: hypothetical protein A3K18_28890 [Lentisphaerae bacterium RIFOXYA12_64_32]OGV86283.1 MAG: hypothetical protein A3K19_13370 [Lentisphaerae bacterium RIFOXYB12_FULL_65_16]